MRSPSRVMDKISYKLNSKSGKAPFLIVSSIQKMNGPNVIPTIWQKYFFKDSKEEYSYLYDGRFNTIGEIKAIPKTSKNVAAIINRPPEKTNKRIVFLRDQLPLDLVSDFSITPYDPANGMELEAVLNMALKNKKSKEIIYVSAHDAFDATPEPDMPVKESDIVKGLYLYKSPKDPKDTNARILASGRSLSTALRISEWIEKKFDIYFEVWSCPSYTKISREIEERYKEELVRNQTGLRETHIQECLKETMPTIAFTCYDSLVCEQLSCFFHTGFMAIGKISGEELNINDHNKAKARCIYHLFKHNLISTYNFRSASSELQWDFD